ncbi:hypothetical protein D3C77_637830 [compost metagenome]
MLYRMLNKEIDNVPSYFGVYITSDNIEEHLNNLRVNREQWSERDKNMFEVVASY